MIKRKPGSKPLSQKQTTSSYDNTFSARVNPLTHPSFSVCRAANRCGKEFWNRKFLGVFDKAIDIEVAPHDTAVLTIRPAEDHPQLLGTARHISGSFSIESLKWVDSANRLEGQSTTIPGTPYTLWVHVPQNFKVSSAKASANDRTLTNVELNQTGELLRLTLPGQQDAVNWQIQFSPASKH